MTKNIQKKKKCKKAKWWPEKVLQIAEEEKEVKDKGERERYTQLNVEFQRTAQRDKKGLLNEQCKEIEENNRMGKIRDLFKKTGDIKGTFCARIGMINDRNSKDHAPYCHICQTLAPSCTLREPCFGVRQSPIEWAFAMMEKTLIHYHSIFLVAVG